MPGYTFISGNNLNLKIIFVQRKKTLSQVTLLFLKLCQIIGDGDFPFDILPRGNFPNVQYPKWQLPKLQWGPSAAARMG